MKAFLRAWGQLKPRALSILAMIQKKPSSWDIGGAVWEATTLAEIPLQQCGVQVDSGGGQTNPGTYECRGHEGTPAQGECQNQEGYFHFAAAAVTSATASAESFAQAGLEAAAVAAATAFSTLEPVEAATPGAMDRAHAAASVALVTVWAGLPHEAKARTARITKYFTLNSFS